VRRRVFEVFEMNDQQTSAARARIDA